MTSGRAAGILGGAAFFMFAWAQAMASASGS